jgi:hypothetical protein
MAMQRADIMGTRHTLNITYPSPQETLLTGGSVVVLPTSEPASPTFSYTVQASDLPTFDGVPVSVANHPMIFAGGLNTTGSAATLCYRIKKNSTSVNTATNLSVTANQYWTLHLFSLSGIGSVVVGDVIEVYLWQITTNALNWDYRAFSIIPSRIFVDSNMEKVFHRVNYTIDGTIPALALGTAASYNTVNALVYFSASTNVALSSSTNFYCQKQDSTYGLIRSGQPDANMSTPTLRNSATNRPNYQIARKITKIEWTPTALGV